VVEATIAQVHAAMRAGSLTCRELVGYYLKRIEAYARPTTDPEIVFVFQTAVEDLKRAGATIIDPATVDGLDAIKRPQDVGPCMGFQYDLNGYLAARGDRVPLKNRTEIRLGDQI
jgi:Asp-tRNA(Asn)/Glu-tRNA(Gln) amidotransferase A subunit family amidase